MKHGIHVISQNHHAEQWRSLRELGLLIISAWIDHPKDEYDEDLPSPNEIWEMKMKHAASSVVTIAYLSSEDKIQDLPYAYLTELGAALTSGSKVLLVGEFFWSLGSMIQHPNVIEMNSLPSAIRLANQLLRQGQEAEQKEKSEQGLWALPYENIVGNWVVRCFGQDSFESIPERTKRVGEEGLELMQAGGVPYEEAEHLLKHVYSRPVGELSQEIAGTLMTLTALAARLGLRIHDVFKDELDRVLALPVEHFHKRRAAKVEAGVAI